MRLLTGLLIIALLALAAACGYSRTLSQEVASANRVIGTLSAGIDSRNAAIARLQSEAVEREQRELALRQSLGRASAAALTRENNIQRLLDENASLRQWYRTALPAAVSGLQQRPAFASADDYLRWLFDSEQLPVSGKPSQD
jgi:LysB family phage lysis regulatory protein